MRMEKRLVAFAALALWQPNQELARRRFFQERADELLSKLRASFFQAVFPGACGLTVKGQLYG
jgi:hypothetical protein